MVLPSQIIKHNMRGILTGSTILKLVASLGVEIPKWRLLLPVASSEAADGLLRGMRLLSLSPVEKPKLHNVLLVLTFETTCWAFQPNRVQDLIAWSQPFPAQVQIPTTECVPPLSRPSLPPAALT